MRRATQWFPVLGLVASLIAVAYFQQRSAKRCGGDMASRDYETSQLHSVSISGYTDVFVAHRDSPMLRVDAPQGVLDELQIDIANGKATLSNTACDDVRYAAHITLSSTKALELTGHVTVTGVTPLKGDEIALTTSGKIDATLELHAAQIALTTKGNTALTATGSAEHVSATMQGKSVLHAAHLATRSYEITASGSAMLTVRATDTLQATLSGDAAVSYHGTPSVTADTSGNSTVTPL